MRRFLAFRRLASDNEGLWGSFIAQCRKVHSDVLSFDRSQNRKRLGLGSVGLNEASMRGCGLPEPHKNCISTPTSTSNIFVTIDLMAKYLAAQMWVRVLAFYQRNPFVFWIKTRCDARPSSLSGRCWFRVVLGFVGLRRIITCNCSVGS